MNFRLKHPRNEPYGARGSRTVDYINEQDLNMEAEFISTSQVQNMRKP